MLPDSSISLAFTRRRPPSTAILSLGTIVGLWTLGASISFAQNTAPPQLTTSPLGIRQERVERMIQELEAKFKSLKLTLQDNEPDRAERLQQALNKAKELLLEKRMAEVTRLLDQSQFDQAGDGQKALLADLRELLTVLLNTESSGVDAQERWNLLSQWKNEIQKLALAERQEQNASNRLAADQPKESAAATQSKFNELSRKQQAIAQEARALAARIQQSADASWPTGEPRPGQASLSSAQQAMQRAGAKLGNQNAAAASTEQQRALDDLQAAESEIDAALNALRDQADDQALTDLARLFRDMLATQQQLTRQTAAIEQKRDSVGGQLTRADRNAVRLIGDDERRLEPVVTAEGTKDAGLAGRSQLALDTLANGSASALAAKVTDLRDAFVSIGNSLIDELGTDASVTTRQAHTEATLQELIAAIEKIQAQKRQASADAQAEGGNKAAASGSSGNQSQQAAQGGKQGGGSKATDTAAASPANAALPHNPWSQLRDKDRDPAYSAIKEKFPARYQQLIEQYYRSFGDRQK